MQVIKSEKTSPFLLKGSNEVGILLFHGWSSPPEELLPLGKYLNSFGYTVSAPLLRGHGTKPEDLLGVKWQDWLADARAALEKLKKESSRIFVGGISMGGDIAMLLSEDKSVEGLLPMGASVRYKFHEVAKVALFFMGLAKTYRKKYYPPWVRKKMGKRNVYLYYPVESAKEVMRLADAVKEYLPRITKPILIMQSDSDHMVSKKSPGMIYDGVNSRIKEIYWAVDKYHVFAGDRKVHEKIGEFIKKRSNVKAQMSKAWSRFATNKFIKNRERSEH